MGEVGIERHGAHERRNGLGNAVALISLVTLGISLESFERRSGAFLERASEFLDGRKRFAKLAAEFAIGATHRVQDVRFRFGLRVNLSDGCARLASQGGKSDGIALFGARDRALDECFAVAAKAEFAGHFEREALVGGSIHFAQKIRDPSSREYLEIGRLLEIEAQGLIERVIEDGFAGGVGEVGEDHTVLRFERTVVLRAEHRNGESRGESKDRHGENRFPKATRVFLIWRNGEVRTGSDGSGGARGRRSLWCSRAGRGWRRRRRLSDLRDRKGRSVHSGAEAEQIVADVACGLVAVFALLLEALVDDELQGLGHIGIESADEFGALLDDGEEQEAGGVTLEGGFAGSHFVENDAEGEEVGAGVERTAEGLLRRHIGGRAESGETAGELTLATGAVIGGDLGVFHGDGGDALFG